MHLVRRGICIYVQSVVNSFSVAERERGSSIIVLRTRFAGQEEPDKGRAHTHELLFDS